MPAVGLIEVAAAIWSLPKPFAADDSATWMGGRCPMITFAIHQVRAGLAGASEDFQQMLGLLVRAASGRDASLVFANPGDWGIDVLVGDLHGRMTVWQAKYFVRGVGRNQQKEVRSSFASAIRAAVAHGYTLERWVLCIPASMDGPTTQWWQGWKARQERHSGVAIDLWDETRLRELLLRPEAADIYRHYYASDLRRSDPGTAAAADPGRGGPDEALFLADYRRQVRGHYGRLDLPNLEHRDRVPIADIYVPTEIFEDIRPERGRPSVPDEVPRLSVADLARLIDRAVLLGDPGCGKTTAASVLMNSCATDPTAKIPFLVTLREYARFLPERSIVGHIEHTLTTLHHCEPPRGLVERLLRTGSALVIFDGLDECNDVPRRRDVSVRVEQFCSAYPLAPVLVTSRLIGYEQARLDRAQFARYRLGAFGREEVEEYARKWFCLPEHQTRGGAEAFLAESAHADDLRSNPLLLSLMCILYNGAGSLPRERTELYEQCATTLLRKWDEERRIHRHLRKRELVEPLVRHLAWWLFDRDEPQAAITERQLLAEVTHFLRAHGLRSGDEARSAAQEFVKFCRERTWVLCADATATGEKLYKFTHHTLLEYYAAAYIAEASETPENLARFLAPHVASGKWYLFGQLAIGVMAHHSDNSADRVYDILLEGETVPGERGELLSFLAVLLESAQPSLAAARNLTRAILGHRIIYDRDCEVNHPLPLLLFCDFGYREPISEEMSSYIGTMVTSGDTASRIDALRLALEVSDVATDPFWKNWSAEQASRYTMEVSADSARSSALRTLAQYAEIITLEQALAMPGGLNALMEPTPKMLESYLTTPYLVWLYMMVPDEIADQEFAVIGRYIADHPDPPWIQVSSHGFTLGDIHDEMVLSHSGAALNELSGLGLAAVHGMCCELFAWEPQRPLADLPMPAQFKKSFRDWAERKVSFVKPHKR